MGYKYYVLYKPDTKQELEIRHDEDFDKWEFNWKNDGGMDRWAKFSDDMQPQIEPNLKEYGYEMPRTIVSEEEYEKALERTSKLMDSETGSIEEHELKRLVRVIEAYEDKCYPIDKPDDGKPKQPPLIDLQ